MGNLFNMLYNVINVGLIPLFGFIADRYKVHAWCNFLSAIVLILTFVFYLFIPPLVPSIMYAVGCALNYTGA